MYTKEDLNELENTKKEMESISSNLNVFLDKVLEIVNLLKNNSDNWYIEDEQLYFESSNLVDKYNSLYNELNKFVKDKFSKYKESNTSKKENKV